MAFHLSRETGKTIRIVSKGAQSFGQVQRYVLFNLMPVFIEIVFTIGAICYLFRQEFFWICFGMVILYFLITILITEWRSKFFKTQSKSDSEYV
jgi:ABC-type transport system involved in Fe-S cluster assembly fused permease/ATPase subunit